MKAWVNSLFGKGTPKHTYLGYNLKKERERKERYKQKSFIQYCQEKSIQPMMQIEYL